MSNSSVSAQIVELRTYLRPLDTEGTVFETRDQHFDRIIRHQERLWTRAKGGMIRNPDGTWKIKHLNDRELAELAELRELLADYKVRLAGRTHWMGGTETVWKREISNFNCSAQTIKRPADFVDAFWLLLNGCGYGGRPEVKRGYITGFHNYIETIESIPSTRGREGGNARNVEQYDDLTQTWTIKIGDSAEAWAKLIGKLLSKKLPVKKLVLDYSELRGAGYRLKGYGWICCGWEPLNDALIKICRILNCNIKTKLDEIELIDILNLLGTVLSTRRAAEITIVDFDNPISLDFAMMKKDYWSPEINKPWRAQSNNSLGFWKKPEHWQLEHLFNLMMEAGGSEPGFYNFEAANRRSQNGATPYYCDMTNPCGEILLNGDGSLCNLVETVVCHFNGEYDKLVRAHYIVARANYRQTCVCLEDGILQPAWEDNQKSLRLCGVGLTGVTAWEYDGDAEKVKGLWIAAHLGTDSMADELGMNRASLVTCLKPSGTASKTVGKEDQEVPAGLHKPSAKYIFNNVAFTRFDPLVDKLRAANYTVIDHKFDPNAVIITLPVMYDNIEFTTTEEGFEINTESAITQLERYRFYQKNYVDHNASCTISYDPSEVPAIIDWLMENWDDYVGVSFLYRTDPLKTAEDLGYFYLPMQPVTKEDWETYANSLTHVDFDARDTNAFLEITSQEDCAGGACPIR